MVRAGFNSDTSFENFANSLIDGYDREAALNERFGEDMEALGRAREADDKVIEMLRDFDRPVTVNNILAANGLMMSRGAAFKELAKTDGRTGDGNDERLKKAADKLIENFVSRETADEAYGELADKASKIIEEAADEAVRELDVGGLKLLHKQISIAGDLARQQNYEVPVNIDGEWTSVNVRFVRGSDEEGSVIATTETERYGKVAAKFLMNGKDLTGYITSDRQDSVDELNRRSDELKDMISADGRNVKELSFVRSDRLDLNAFAREEGEAKEVSSSDLYEAAKAFIKYIGR